MSSPVAATPSARRVLFASLIGTTIEFFDFYIYATAAVLVFPHLFFPAGDAAAATLQSLATFAIAFFARPIGSALFGHFGDRVGRKATLVAALMTMGLSTVAIGLLPGHAEIGVWAPLLLALCRFGQGLGLGGEWGGAVLLATENAPPGKQAWYGMFPQLGAPIGFILSTGSFLLLTRTLSEADFLAWGWRLPFLASLVLVLVGLQVRLSLTETPAFQHTLAQGEREAVPFLAVWREHKMALARGTLMVLTCFVIFYLMTVFALSWGTSHLGHARETFLQWQLIGVVCFGLTIPLSAWCADRFGQRRTLLVSNLLMLGFAATAFDGLFGSGSEIGVILFLMLGLGLMGLVYGPAGALLSGQFPTAVRYTGASLAFNLAGILGASLAPYAATWLATEHGLGAVGLYLGIASVLTLLALWHAPAQPHAH